MVYLLNIEILYKYELLYNIEFLGIFGIILCEDYFIVDIVVMVGKVSNFLINEKIIGVNMVVKFWKIFFYLFLIWNFIFYGEISKF